MQMDKVISMADHSVSVARNVKFDFEDDDDEQVVEEKLVDELVSALRQSKIPLALAIARKLRPQPGCDY
jgi:hypothetical protein